MAWAAEGPGDRTVAERYPFLVSGVLTQAHLVSLPDGVLARSGEISIGEDDLRQAIFSAPHFAGEGLQRDPTPALEQVLADRLLAALAKEEAAKKGEPATDEQALVHGYIGRLAAAAKPSDVDVRAFYDHNQDACGRLPFEQVRGYVEQLLTKRAQDDCVNRFVRELGRERPIEVSAPWIEAHAAAGTDNPIDRLRGKGKPILAVFSAASCCGPDKMKPVLTELEQAVAGTVEIVYVEARDSQALGMRHRVSGIPTSIVFDAHGVETFRHQGLVDAEHLRSALASSMSHGEAGK